MGCAHFSWVHGNLRCRELYIEDGFVFFIEITPATEVNILANNIIPGDDPAVVLAAGDSSLWSK
jgi:hypothetical protein